MRRWALIVGGRVSNVVDQSEAPAIAGNWVELNGTFGPGDLFNGATFTRLSGSPARRLTKLQFVGRMTPTEFTNLLTAARTDASAEMFVKMLDWATPDPDGTSVDLDDPRTIAGVQASFSAERAAQILA